MGATSAGVPNRPSGTATRFASREASSRVRSMPVSIGPGAIAFTSTLSAATSRASDLVRPSTPALAAA